MRIAINTLVENQAARRGLFVVNQNGSFIVRQDYEAVGGLQPDLPCVMDTDLYIHIAFVNIWLSGFRKQAMSKTVAETAKTHVESKSAQRWYWLNVKSNLVWRCSYVGWQV